MSSKKILTSQKNRKCRFQGCKRILSIYNHEVHCHIHQHQAAGELQFKTFEK